MHTMGIKFTKTWSLGDTLQAWQIMEATSEHHEFSSFELPPFLSVQVCRSEVGGWCSWISAQNQGRALIWTSGASFKLTLVTVRDQSQLLTSTFSPCYADPNTSKVSNWETPWHQMSLMCWIPLFRKSPVSFKGSLYYVKCKDNPHFPKSVKQKHIT